MRRSGKETGQRDTAKAEENGDGILTDTTTSAVERLEQDTEIKSNMINMGECIQWGSETSLMDQCAATLRALATERDRLREAVGCEAEAGSLFIAPEHAEFAQVIYKPVAGPEYELTERHLRAARAALEEIK